MSRPRVGVVVLAGGRAKRFRSTTPKVLHRALGRPLLGWILEQLRALHRSQRLERVCVVVPPGGAVEAAVGDLRYPFPVDFAVQREPRGTGDAARVGSRRLGGADEVLVIAGDMPLIRADSLEAMIHTRRSAGASAGMLSCEPSDPGALGRIQRDAGGRVVGIVEARDATDAQLAIREVGLSAYVFAQDALARFLPRLRNVNAAGEYYLTDAVALLADDGAGVTAVVTDPEEGIGANTRAEFDAIRRVLHGRTIDALFDRGVTVVDADTTYVDAGVEVGAETVLLPNTFLEGSTRVGEGCEIGPNVRLVDTRVRDRAVVTFAVARGSDIGPEAEVGPFASLREGTVLKRGAKAGTFVEMKAAKIGERTKVPHLSYVGDVTVGKDGNIGAGTITCNYNPFELAPDGSSKHKTWIGDDVYTGSGTMLVAPVRIGRGSQTGAASVVTRNVGERKLVYGAPATERGRAKERADGKGGRSKSERPKAAKRPSPKRKTSGRESKAKSRKKKGGT